MSENTITLREQATALVTLARTSDGPEPVLDLLADYLREQGDAPARMALLVALVPALAFQQGQALNLLEAISAAQHGEGTP